MNDLERAIEYATTHHAGQTDKAGATYVRHPLRVMGRMETKTERIVAILHDVVEDTDRTPDDIEAEFDAEIRAAVETLTKRSAEESYMAFIERVAAHPVARRVKIADIEDNMDLTRLDTVDEGVIDNQRKYHEAWTLLQRAETSQAG